MANSSEQVGGEEKMDSKGKLVQSTDEEPQTVVVVVVEGSAAADTEPSADDTHVDMEHSDNVDDDNVSHNSSAQGQRYLHLHRGIGIDDTAIPIQCTYLLFQPLYFYYEIWVI